MPKTTAFLACKQIDKVLIEKHIKFGTSISDFC